MKGSRIEDASVLFTPKRIGCLELRNRFVRSATDESMAGPDGEVTDELVKLHVALAKGEVGLQNTGHAFVHRKGRYSPKQLGIDYDSLVPGLKRLVQEVHANGGRIFVELNHAGAQSKMLSVTPIAPSPVPSPRVGRIPAEASVEEIWEAIEAFADAARRASEASFDGITLHCGHGYLISEFSSPYSNRRDDEWGGDPARRTRFMMEIIKSIREKIGPSFPLSLKYGVGDLGVAGGLAAAESIPRLKEVARLGVDAVEVTCGLAPGGIAVRQYAGLTQSRAVRDLLLHKVFPANYPPEAYFQEFAEKVREAAAGTPLILVGGLRSVETMAGLVREGKADFISMARPFIREPDIASQIRRGRRGYVGCTSCNMCVAFEGSRSIRCWRRYPHLPFLHTIYKAQRRLFPAKNK